MASMESGLEERKNLLGKIEIEVVHCRYSRIKLFKFTADRSHNDIFSET